MGKAEGAVKRFQEAVERFSDAMLTLSKNFEDISLNLNKLKELAAKHNSWERPYKFHR